MPQRSVREQSARCTVVLVAGKAGRAPDIPIDPQVGDHKEAVMNDNIKDTEHPEQDPAEGSREIIDRELKRQTNRTGREPTAGRPADHPTGDSPRK
jgi:hypothetical protein